MKAWSFSGDAPAAAPMAAAGALSLLRCGAGLAVAATERSRRRFLAAGPLAGHALRASRAGRAARAGVERVVLLARELAVVVLVELAEARIELGRVLRLVARDEAVVVLVEALEAHGCAARPRAAATTGVRAPGRAGVAVGRGGRIAR